MFNLCMNRITNIGKRNVQDESQEDEEVTNEETDDSFEKIELKRLSNKFCQLSLNTFGFDSKIRRLSILIVENKYFDKIIILLIGINSILLGGMDYTWKDDQTETREKPTFNILVDNTELFFIICFTIECVSKILACGIWFGNQNCYLQEGWNWLDFIVVVSGLLQNFSFMQNVSVLRTFRLFRPLRSLAMVPSMRLLVDTLFKSIRQLWNIIVLDTYFILTFAIFGLQMYEGVTHKRCRQTPVPVCKQGNKYCDWLPVEDDHRICGSFHQCNADLGQVCGSLYDFVIRDHFGSATFINYELEPHIDYNRDSISIFQNFGITNFDSIGAAYLTVFQCTTLEGWTNIMFMIQDGYNMYISVFFFVVCILICNYFLLNLTVAVMLDKFKTEQLDITKKIQKKYEMNFRRVREKKQYQHIMFLHNKIPWRQKCKIWFTKIIYLNPGNPPKDEDDEYIGRYKHMICRFCWRLVKIPLFDTFIMSIIIISTMVLATDSYHEECFSDGHEKASFLNELGCSNLIMQTNNTFVALFAFECIFKIVGLEFNSWKADIFNIFDLVIVTSSIIEIYITDKQIGVMSALRALRLCRLIKLVRQSYTLRCLLDSIAETLSQVANFLVILAIFIYVFSLLGMEIFAGKFKFDDQGNYDPENGKLSRQNYDSILWAVVTVFQVLVGDKWNEVMYKAYLSSSPTSVLYFFFLVLIGKIIMLNLFLAILLGYFEQSSLNIRGQREDLILKQFEIGNKVHHCVQNQVSSLVQNQLKQSLSKINLSGKLGLINKQEKVILVDKISNEDLNKSYKFEMKLQPIQNDSNRGNELQIDNSPKGTLDLDASMMKNSSLDSSRDYEEEYIAQINPIDTYYLEKDSRSIPVQLDQSSNSTAKAKSQVEDINYCDKKLNDLQLGRSMSTIIDKQFNFKGREIQKDIDQQNKGNDEINIETYENMDTQRHLLNDQDDKPRTSFRNRTKIEIVTNNAEIHFTKRKVSLSGNLEIKGTDFGICESDSDLKTVTDKKIPMRTIIWNYLKESSLFIFHKECRIRRFLLRLTVPPISKKKMNKDSILSQLQHIDLDSDEQHFDEQNYLSQANVEPNTPSPNKDGDYTPGDNSVSSPSQIRSHLQIKNKNNSSTQEDNTKLFINKRSLLNNKQMFSEMDKNSSQNTSRLEQPIITKYVQSETSQRIQEIHQGLNDKLFFYRWTLNQWFENFIYLLILVSMILLVVENPLSDPASKFSQNVSKIDYTITYLFALEALCRIIGLGFYWSSIPTKKGYIRSGSNQLDFFVCIGCDLIIKINESSIFDSGLNEQTLKSFKVLRSLRALRPLRVINRNQGLQLAVGSLFGAMPAIANGMIVCCLIVFIYAIIGIGLFKGQFHHCYFEFTQNDAVWEKIITKRDCEVMGGRWQSGQRNFDDIWSALSVLFEIITTEGWLDVMYAGVDSVGVEMQPKANYRPLMSLYFISFIIVGNIFILNLFVGIVIDKFNRLKDKMNGYGLMTSHQKECIESEKQMTRLQLIKKRNPPSNHNQLLAYKVMSNQHFDYFIAFCITLSTLLMSLRYYTMTRTYESYLELFSNILTFIYNVEAGIKIMALGDEYFSNSWNRFDLFIVVSSDSAIVLEIFAQSYPHLRNISMLFNTIRILRVFRLIRVSRSLRVLIDSLIVILPSITNVLSLIFLMFFIFAVIGMNMFSGVKHQKELNENSNFTNFGMSIVLLMRSSTGENWNIIMRELAVTNTTLALYNHHHNSEGDSLNICYETQSHQSLLKEGPMECGTAMVYLYFIMFIIVIQTMMLNLLTAVVLEGYSSTNKEHTGAVTSDHFNELIAEWVCYDPNATGWIDVKNLIFLIFGLSEPLGRYEQYKTDLENKFTNDQFKSEGKIIDKGQRYIVHVEKNMIVPFIAGLQLLCEMNLTVYKDSEGLYKCHFKDVIKQLTSFALNKRIPGYDPSGIEPKHHDNLRRQWREKYTDLKTTQVFLNFTTGELWAGLFITSCVKNVLSMHKLKRQMNFGLQNSNNFIIPPSNMQQKINNSSFNESNLKSIKKKVVSDQPKKEKNLLKKSKMKVIGQPQHEIAEQNARMVQMQNETEFTHQDDYDYARDLYKIVMKERRKVEDFKNYDNKDISKSNIPSSTDSLSSEEENKTIKDDNPQLRKDSERSTWWMEDQQKNRKMKQWMKNLSFQEQRVKKSSLKLKVKKFQYKSNDNILTNLRQQKSKKKLGTVMKKLEKIDEEDKE